MSEAPYSFTDLNQLFHVPARLGIATALYSRPSGMTFTELKNACDLSDGNLSRHLSRLEDEGVVSSSKRFVEKTPQTTVTLTANGRARFEEYMEKLKMIVANHAPQRRLDKTSRDGRVAYE